MKILKLIVAFKSLQVLFCPFVIIEFIYIHFENRVMLQLVLGGVAGVSHSSTGHEQTQLNRVCYFHLFDVFSLLPKDLTIQNLLF